MKKVLGLTLSVLSIFLLAGCTKKADLKLGQVNFAAHGTNGFAVTTVVMNGDKIEIAYIDEFQFLTKEESTCVANNEGLSANYKDDVKCLASKRDNNESYSKMMKDFAEAKKELVDGYEKIAKFAEGKTITELEKEIDGKSKEDVLDAVSGATLVDAKGYLESIIAAAKVAK